MISDVETSIRGFSFMPEINIKEIDLQYVENSELERAWRSSRRERQKQQEQKIWEEFIEEQDIVRSAFKNDPYQFIEQIPETHLKEILDKELSKIKDKEAEEEIEQEDHCEATSTHSDTPVVVNQNVDVDQRDSQHVLHIYYDEKDNEEMSGHEEDAANDSGASPLCTVREKEEEKKEPELPEPDQCSEKVLSNSSANIASGIESSIYCAKVKDLRTRIKEELTSIIASVQRLDVFSIEREDLKKTLKRASEFCSRFSRIHLYQLQRQTQDVRRHNGAAPLPFARHTHFQSQMLRVLSLHQNLLQAFCAFHKSLDQTQYIGDSVQLGLATSQLLRAAPAPASPLPAAELLYCDDLLLTCDQLDEALRVHSSKAEELIKYMEETKNPLSQKSNKSYEKQRPAGAGSKSGSKSSSRADGRLSMYSLDTLRINLKGKTSSTKNNQSSGTSKLRGSASNTSQKPAPVKPASPKGKRKAPVRGRARAGGDDVRTLVQAVACVSSHVSLEASSRRSGHSKEPSHRSGGSSHTQRSVEGSRRPRRPRNTPRSAHAPADGSEQSPSERDTEERRAETWELSKDLVQDGAGSRRSEKGKPAESGAGGCEVSRLLRELCGGDATGKKKEKVIGSKNAQLHWVSGSSPRQPTTPQLLRILEESIQKKSPRQINPKPPLINDAEKFRMPFNISEKTVENLFQYRTKFVQHMLTSSMYANSALEKPWEVVNSVSDQIVDELLLACAKEMELPRVVQKLYKSETR